MSAPAGRLALGRLGLDRGGHLLVRRALRGLVAGERLEVSGDAPDLGVHLRAWARRAGVGFAEGAGAGPWFLEAGPVLGRRAGATRAGAVDPLAAGAVHEHPPATWGLAPRGALVEAGAPAFDWPVHDKEIAWTDEAARLYAQAAASQWDPASAVDWSDVPALDDDVEDAVVQVMTYLVENETAALVIPARFASQVHPHFREIVQLLAIQAADEARHVEVFTRRATLVRGELGLTTVGGQVSLKTLIDEPDFAMATFLLSVLGEGSFLSLLWFLRDHGPDAITRRIAQLAAQDEARHVAFGLAHLQRHARLDPSLLPKLAMAMRRRHDALRETAGLNEEVFDALVLMAAGSWDPEGIASGFERVQQLQQDMHSGRVSRLVRLGFAEDEAAALSHLHTRNFM